MSPQTPPSNTGRASLSPLTKTDGISLDKKHLPRQDAVQSIYEAAKTSQFVVLGSPASTGKSSLLQLLEARLEEEDKSATVHYFPVRKWGIAVLIQTLVDLLGVKTGNRKELAKIENTWLLVDDAQNAYDEEYHSLWETIVKDVQIAEAKGLFVVIAATYDLNTPVSPVSFQNLKHVNPNISIDEANELIIMYLKHWDLTEWVDFKNTMLDISSLQGEHDKFHIGVIMAAMRLVDEARKNPNMTISEDRALELLRTVKYASRLDRCFYLGSNAVTNDMKEHLLQALLSEETDSSSVNYLRTALAPLVRAGIVNTRGQFSCVAAKWYYNRECFPNRPLDAPESLYELIQLAVGSMSAKRLRDARQPGGGFPKEAAFQHLVNETMSMHLPANNVIIPELNTVAVDSHDFSAEPVTGELDFYVNGKKQWCIELLREGKMVGEHLNRFGRAGKYRKVETKDYFVVDCRGPMKGRGANVDDHRCNLYFSEDFSTCICQAKGHATVEIKLQL